MCPIKDMQLADAAQGAGRHYKTISKQAANSTRTQREQPASEEMQNRAVQRAGRNSKAMPHQAASETSSWRPRVFVPEESARQDAGQGAKFYSKTMPKQAANSTRTQEDQPACEEMRDAEADHRAGCKVRPHQNALEAGSWRLNMFAPEELPMRRAAQEVRRLPKTISKQAADSTRMQGGQPASEKAGIARADQGSGHPFKTMTQQAAVSASMQWDSSASKEVQMVEADQGAGQHLNSLPYQLSIVADMQADQPTPGDMEVDEAADATAWRPYQVDVMDWQDNHAAGQTQTMTGAQDSAGRLQAVRHRRKRARRLRTSNVSSGPAEDNPISAQPDCLLRVTDAEHEGCERQLACQGKPVSLSFPSRQQAQEPPQQVSACRPICLVSGAGRGIQ